jgi:hypothetical protein
MKEKVKDYIRQYIIKDEYTLDEVADDILFLFGITKSTNNESNIDVNDPNAPWNLKKDISEI